MRHARVIPDSAYELSLKDGVVLIMAKSTLSIKEEPRGAMRTVCLVCPAAP